MFESSWESFQRLTLKRGHRVIGFELASLGELQFCRHVLEEYGATHPGDWLYVFHQQDTAEAVDDMFPALRPRLRHVQYVRLLDPWFRRLDLYVTTSQFSTGPPGVYTLTLFHGQPSKGFTFGPFGNPRRNPLELNDALFLYGPLQRQALEEHCEIHGVWPPAHLSLFNVGYTKSDYLLSGRYDRTQFLERLGLDPKRRTILYAPAFNEGASMREYGPAVVEALCKMQGCNVLAKLAVDCQRRPSDAYANGGIDWFSVLGEFEERFPGFRLLRDAEADPALASSDVLVTCISSISFEFLALRKPVIYLDTPKFFTVCLPAIFPGTDTSSWSSRTVVNGGREYGLVVCPAELQAAVAEVLGNPDAYPRRKETLPEALLYNPATATKTAVGYMTSLVAARARSKRPLEPSSSIARLLVGHVPRHRKVNRWLITRVRHLAKNVVQAALHRRGLTLVRTGRGYIDAKSVVDAARREGLSVCDYRERAEGDSRKVGRRESIISRLHSMGVFAGVQSVCEIGPGTGMYLERVIELAAPTKYEIYETDPGWAEFLESTYGNGSVQLIRRPADGTTLSNTKSGSIDLVHAHGVFVYLPLLQTFGYLKECLRTCRPGGYIVFDCFLDSSWSSLATAEAWNSGPWSFPVVFPKQLLNEFAVANGLEEIRSFQVIYGSGVVDYVVWRKRGVLVNLVQGASA